MSIEGQGHFFTIYLLGVVLYWAKFISNLADVSSRIADVFLCVLINESLTLNVFAQQNVPVASNS